MTTRETRAARGWLWIAAIWSAIGLIEAAQTVVGMHAEGMHHNWAALFATDFLSWLPWALVTPLVLRLGRTYPLKPLVCLMHIGAAVLINVVSSAWVAGLIVLLNPYATFPVPGPFTHVWFGNFFSALLISLMLYAAVLAVDHILESRMRLERQQAETARLNEQLSNAKLDALRRQIEPHFLFNSLNSIAGLVREKQNDAAVSMVARLSDFLRRVLEDSTRQLVSLGQEMEFSEKYLEIQRARFADRLQLTVDVPDDLLSAEVPSLLLQPIVENAVKHGISKRAKGGAIRISASRNSGMLTLRIYNDGPAFPVSGEARYGVGMANVRTRLQSLYGSGFRLTVENQQPDGVEVAVSLPYVQR
jgi:sensor histidine kinase YesM